MNNLFRQLISLTVLLLVSVASFGQSSEEIAAAKAIARSYGYSEAEIGNMQSKFSTTERNTDAGQYEHQRRDRRDRRDNTVDPNVKRNSTVNETDVATDDDYEDDEYMRYHRAAGRKALRSDIYGHNFFISDGLSYISLFNAPVPDSYTLGPGDEIDIDVWGSANTSVYKEIGADGTIIIQGAGPVHIAGLSLSKAETVIRSRLASIYSGLSDGTAHISVSVSHLRGVSVYVLGEVITPGVYSLNSLSSIASAIYIAGGVKKTASVRNIYLYRGGRKVADFDLYNFIFNGRYDTNMRLQDGDIISVGAKGDIVEVKGSVIRPMKYEVKSGETISDVLRFSGSFDDMADKSSVHVDRHIPGKSLSYDVPESEFGTFTVFGADEITVRSFEKDYDSRVTVTGAVLFEGDYSISDSLKSVKDLLRASGGLREGAYTQRAYISRLDKEMKPAMISFDLSRLLETDEDVPLFRKDSLKIYYIDQIKEKTTVSISGEVNSPGTFDFREGMMIGDLILMAGGFKEGASLTNIEIASRGTLEKGTVTTLDVDGDPNLMNRLLSPYDLVYVRSLEFFKKQPSITINGEVKYPGTYVINKNEARLSDVISRAGGFTSDAFVKGAKLTRVLSSIEYERLMAAMEIARQRQNNHDTTRFNMDSTSLGDSFLIAINLEEAVNNPGSFHDVVLRSGDVIEVPQMNNTVKISGAVYFPNTVSFNPKYSINDYLGLAGGCIKGARKNKIYAVYMNGFAASRKSRDFRIEPGMEIVVPQKTIAERRQVTPSEIAALAQSTTSIASLVAVLVNVLK